MLILEKFLEKTEVRMIVEERRGFEGLPRGCCGSGILGQGRFRLGWRDNRGITMSRFPPLAK